MIEPLLSLAAPDQNRIFAGRILGGFDKLMYVPRQVPHRRPMAEI